MQDASYWKKLKYCLTAVFLLLGGIAMVLTGLWFVIVNANFLRHAETAPGTVTTIVEKRGVRGTNLYHPIVRFRPRHHGTGITFEASPGFTWVSPFDVGDRVKVAYNEGDPEDAKIISFWMLWFLPVVLMLFGVGCLFAGRQTLTKTE